MNRKNITVRLPCKTCGESILPSTAERTGGVCMPCQSGYRKNIEFAKARWKEEKERMETIAGRHWQTLSRLFYDVPEDFATLSVENRAFFAVGILRENVCNGGFHQYFVRNVAGHFVPSIRGLMEMGATQSLRRVMRAKEIYFGEEPMPLLLDDRLACISSLVLSDEQELEIKTLEAVFRSEQSLLSEQMRKFAEKHDLFGGGSRAE